MTRRPNPWTLDSTEMRVFPYPDLHEVITKEDAYIQYGKNSCTLVRSPRMRTLVVVIEAGKRLDEHEAPGPVTIAVLKGLIRLYAANPNGFQDLKPGDVAVMSADARHAVEALERSSFLVVIAGDEKQGDSFSGIASK